MGGDLTGTVSGGVAVGEHDHTFPCDPLGGGGDRGDVVGENPRPFQRVASRLGDILARVGVVARVGDAHHVGEHPHGFGDLGEAVVSHRVPFRFGPVVPATG